MDEKYLEITPEISIPLDEIQFSFARSSGPGGQNVNKVSSKALLRWNIANSEHYPEEAARRFAVLYPSSLTLDGDVVLTSQLTRDAPKNKADCLQKLQTMLQTALKKPKPRIPTRPTKGSIRRRLADKAKHSEKKSRRRFSDGDV